MSTRTKDELGTLSLLGNKKTVYKDDYAPEVLETFPNKHPDNDYFVKFICPEFTSLCPISGQPDFATIYISYVPGERMVESKSLKLYLYSFRNHGDFHEDCMNIIMKDLIRLMDPKYIEVWGKFTPRGGISIDPYCNYGKAGTLWEQVAFQRLTQHDLYPEKIDNRQTYLPVLLCLAVSYIRIPAAIAAFKDSTFPSIGILIRQSAESDNSSLRPFPSFPMKNAVPSV